jgi:hypothetical protein
MYDSYVSPPLTVKLPAHDCRAADPNKDLSVNKLEVVREAIEREAKWRAVIRMGREVDAGRY